ncbi:MAG: hypothetical protein RI958_467 [Actinomycetota bacterium]
MIAGLGPGIDTVEVDEAVASRSGAITGNAPSNNTGNTGNDNTGSDNTGSAASDIVGNAGTTSSYRASAPDRLADTRWTTCGCERVDATTIRVTVAGRSGIPLDATAAHITVTVTDIASNLHVTAWPTGRARPNSSILNATPADIAAATSTPLALGVGGAIDVHTSARASIVIDVAGAWVPTTATDVGGRYRPRSSTRITVPLAAGIPKELALDNSAVALALAFEVAPSARPGYVSAWPAGAPWPGTSLLNHRGTPRWTTAIVPTGVNGAVQLLSSTDALLTIDVVGAIVDTSGPDGLLVPSPPTRLLDTRSDLGLPWAAAGQMPASGSVIRHRASGGSASGSGGSGGSGAVAVTVITTVGGSAGVVAAASGAIVHHRAGADAGAITAYAPVDADGTISYALEGATHVVSDVMGYFTGTLDAARQPGSQPAPELRVLPDRPWTPARRSGTPCETRLLGHLDRFMPAHLRWTLPFVEIAVSDVLPVAGNAAFANFGYLRAHGFVVPSIGAVSGPMTMLVRASACNGGNPEAYMATHEAVGHLVDSLFDDIDGWSRTGGRATGFAFRGISPMMPAFATTPAQQAVELFADCVTAVLGAAIGPHYTDCTDTAWRAQTSVVLGADLVHMDALPVQCAVRHIVDADLPFTKTVLGAQVAAGEAPAIVPTGSTISTCTVAVVTPFGTLWGTTDDVVVLATPDGSIYRPIVTGSMAAYALPTRES